MPKPTISSALTASGVMSTTYTSGSPLYTITASRVPTSFAATGLPTGLVLNAVTGAITGTPTVEGTFTVSMTATNSDGTSSPAALAMLIHGPPLINSASTAGAQVGQAFSYQTTALYEPATYAQTGLPASLNLDTNSGVISGTPVQGDVAGSPYTVNLTSTNAYGTSPTFQLALSVSSSLPVITSSLSASAKQGDVFSYQITATNSPTSYSAQNLAIIVPGLGINTTTGLISGTPTASPGNKSVIINATNPSGTSPDATLVIALASSAPVITSATTASWAYNSSFSFQVTTTNTSTSYTISGLPAGLSISPTGLITSASALSAPCTNGATTGSVTATNQFGSDTKNLTVTLTGCPPIVTANQTATATVGTAFNYQVLTTNPVTSFEATNLTGTGLDINTTNGAITGTPTYAGPINSTITATNASGSGTGSLAITVNPAKPAISPNPQVVNAVRGVAITPYQVTATNSPTSFRATSLPSGASMSSSGLVTGTINSAGTTNSVVYASNISGEGAGGTLQFVVTNPPAVTSYSIFASDTVPSLADQNDGTSGITNGIELGMRFTPSQSGQVTAVRFYKASTNTGTHTGTLWGPTGTNLGQVTFAGETASGWQQQNFASPINVTSGQTYTISYNTRNGHYSSDSGGFNSSKTSGPLTAPISAGRYVYNFETGYPYPQSIYNNENYYVDVVFQAVQTPPTVTSSSTLSGTVGQSLSYQITASNAPLTSYRATGYPSWLSAPNASGLMAANGTAILGSGTFNVYASNATGESAAFPVTYSVAALPVPVITSSSSASGVVSSSFSYQITASNCTPSCTYAATGLPAWLSVNSSTGVVSGTTPSSITSGSFSVTAANGSGTSIAQSVAYNITIVSALTDPIPADRKYTSSIAGDSSLPSAWAKYSGVPNGIPTNRTQCAGGTVAAGTSAATIQSRLNGCAANTYLLLAAGTWSNPGRISVPSNVTLRGAGANLTRFLGDAQVRIGNGAYVSGTLNTNITSGGTKGTNTIVVASTTNLSVGTYIEVDKTTDSNISNPIHDGRDVMQMNRITDISGTGPYTITVRNPWVSDFTSAYTARIHYYYGTAPNYAAAVEDIGINRQANGSNTVNAGTAVLVDGCDSCWVKGVETSNFHGYHVYVYNTMNTTIADSFFHDTTDGPNNSGINCVASSQYGVGSNNRVENTIFNKDFPAIEFGNGVSACNGWYIGYNYVHGSVSQYGDGMVTWTMDMDHGGMSLMDLWEGNVAEMFGVDNYFGGSALGTSFRNWWTGWNRNYNAYGSPVRLLTWAYRFNMVGNVLGSSQENPNVYDVGCGTTGIYELGYPNIGNCNTVRETPDATPGTYPDPQVAARLMRWGNYDYYTDGVPTNGTPGVWRTSELGGVATPPDQTLIQSYVYTSKPSWFGSVAWPPIGPDVTGGNNDTAGKANKIPAQLCWESMGSNALVVAGGYFNRAACYP
jgi:hypothetical protein